MSAFRGGGSGGARRFQDPPLIKLVEEYLVQNKHRSFINLDEMGESIRGSSFKFSRMKQSVFKDQLKRAYQSYSTTASSTQEEISGGDNQFDNTPLDDQTLRDMGGLPSDSDGETEPDSVQIDESAQIDFSKDAGVDQMKSLYMAPSASSDSKPASFIKEASSTFTQKDADRLDLAKSIAKACRNPPGSPRAVDCVSISSDVTDKSPTKSDLGKNKDDVTSTSKESSLVKDSLMEEEEDSGSDLEIIEEVKSTPKPKPKQPSSSTNPALNSTNTNKNEASVSNPVSRTPNRTPGSMNRGPPTANQNQPGRRILNGVGGPANGPQTSASSRGIKRKPAGKNEEEPETGINDDLTRKRPRKEVTVVHDTGYKLKDFAGSEKVVEEICKLVMHLKHPEIYQTLGVIPPRGFLLHGPPGTGKTLLANAIAGELSMPMLKVAGTELVSGISGESESNIRELFNQAVTIAPCIIFIDEIDSVTPRRENANKEMERRIVAQLLACIDDLISKEKGNQVLLIGATNRIESIDTALRRAGRFDREICLGIPDEKSREKILNVICRNVKLDPDVTTKVLAKLTPGYVGADLQALVREAAVQAVNRKLFTEKVSSASGDGGVSSESKEETMEVDSEANTVTGTPPTQELTITANEAKNEDEMPSSLKWITEMASLTPEELNDLFVCMSDYKAALKTVQPSSKREGFATVPDTTWDDIGALQDIRDELQVSILGPVKHAEAFKTLGLTTPAGVLLCGPPGCGKTLLAKAVANEAGINFISVKGPELLNMYVGESERAVRQCFLRARNSSPCVIFFDELDALCPRRSDVADSGSGGRIVNQLLTEMDGIESRQGVFVMAATNRPDIIDPAVLRPGRLDKILFVNLPTPKDRSDILKAITKNAAKPTLADDVNLEEIANSPECEDYTGADLAALVREASIAAFRELILHPKEGEACSAKDLKVSSHHFKTAFTKTKPSVGKEDRLKYKMMAEKYSSIR